MSKSLPYRDKDKEKEKNDDLAQQQDHSMAARIVGTSTPPRKLTSTSTTTFTTTHLPDNAVTGTDTGPSTSVNMSMISPSKARIQLQLTHQITLLESWLTDLFAPNPVPPHLLQWKSEVGPLQPYTDSATSASTDSHSHPQTGGVLKALQDLQSANLAADKLAGLLHAARLEELDQHQAHRAQVSGTSTVAAGVLAEVHAALTPTAQDALRSLAKSATLLGLPATSSSRSSEGEGGSGSGRMLVTAEFGSAITAHTQSGQALEQQLAALQSLHVGLEEQLARLLQDEEKQYENASDGDGGGRSGGAAEQLHAQTIQHTRETKQIAQKIGEYRERIGQLERALQGLLSTPLPPPPPPPPPPPSRGQQVVRAGGRGVGDDEDVRVKMVEDVLAVHDRVEERKARVRKLEQRLAAFHGLPPDLDASRNEVRRATMELEALKARRDDLFQQLGQG